MLKMAQNPPVPNLFWQPEIIVCQFDSLQGSKVFVTNEWQAKLGGKTLGIGAASWGGGDRGTNAATSKDATRAIARVRTILFNAGLVY